MTLDEYYRFLEILISKHNEQSASYYKRLTLYFTIITVIIVGLSTITTSDEIVSEVIRKGGMMCISFLGFTFSIIWLLILSISNRWLQYWRSKIFLFEYEHIELLDSKISNMFMLDRYEKMQPESLKNIAFCDYSKSRNRALKYSLKIHMLIKIFLVIMVFAFVLFFVWAIIH